MSEYHADRPATGEESERQSKAKLCTDACPFNSRAQIVQQSPKSSHLFKKHKSLRFISILQTSTFVNNSYSSKCLFSLPSLLYTADLHIVSSNISYVRIILYSLCEE